IRRHHDARCVEVGLRRIDAYIRKSRTSSCKSVTPKGRAWNVTLACTIPQGRMKAVIARQGDDSVAAEQSVCGAQSLTDRGATAKRAMKDYHIDAGPCRRRVA